MPLRIRRKPNISKRIKTSHKRKTVDKKLHLSKISPQYRDINNKVSELTKQAKQQTLPTTNPTKKPSTTTPLITIDEEMTVDQLRKLIDNNERKRERVRLSLDDKLYLEPLLAKYGVDYKKMARDVKLNKMQWNQHQVEVKHKEYQKL